MLYGRTPEECKCTFGAISRRLERASVKNREKFWNALASILLVVVEGTDSCLCIAVQFVLGAALGSRGQGATWACPTTKVAASQAAESDRPPIIVVEPNQPSPGQAPERVVASAGLPAQRERALRALA